MSDPVAHQGPAASDTASAAGNVEYRVAHLHDRLAAEELGELGVRAEIRAGAIVITGTVPSAQCRETLLRVAHEELAGLTVHTDVLVAETTGPDHAEEL
ncbi:MULTISPECIES: BON domain-containing protein [unclassified Streptomyces]|uniref:BON domain-containing protein n=1 Tax=unclassified Streptomyces TaxID=2593676 RepID=UPI002442D42C|nr:BON domain-containing protein [Streptomyces sp. DH41]MDG9728028.1 BON domain-containing protein [Streptomyces sp. DH41]